VLLGGRRAEVVDREGDVAGRLGGGLGVTGLELAGLGEAGVRDALRLVRGGAFGDARVMGVLR
jgi:hypothetical protein